MNPTYRRLLSWIARPLLRDLSLSFELDSSRYQDQADDLRGKPGRTNDESYRLGLASAFRSAAARLRLAAEGAWK